MYRKAFYSAMATFFVSGLASAQSPVNSTVGRFQGYAVASQHSNVDSFWRLDTITGVVSICTSSSSGLSCMVANERDGRGGTRLPKSGVGAGD
jgi:hypothetical protein